MKTAQVLGSMDLMISDLTPIIPVYREESKRYFIASDLVPVSEVQLSDDVTVQTAPLVIGARVDLLGISQSDELIATGMLDSTDSIDASLGLKCLYLHLETLGKPDEVVCIPVLEYPLARAAYPVQGNYREMDIHFVANLPLASGFMTAQGEPTAILADAQGIPCVKVVVTGKVNLELGECLVNALRISSFMVGDTLVRAKVAGYELDAKRVNLNRRPVRKVAT